MTQLSEELLGATKRRSVTPICGTDVDFLWDRIWELFQDLPRWTLLYTEKWTFEQVKMGHLQVWNYSDTESRGMMVTRINIFPKCKVLDVVGLSGISGVEFLDDLDAVCETLARQNDCKYLSCSARDGMARLLQRKHRGAKLYSVLSRPVGLLRSS